MGSGFRSQFPNETQIMNNISRFREELPIWRKSPILRIFPSCLSIQLCQVKYNQHNASCTYNQKKKRRRLCSIVFFQPRSKWWCKVNQNVTSSIVLQNGTCTYKYWSMERQFLVQCCFYWYGTWLEKSFTQTRSDAGLEGVMAPLKPGVGNRPVITCVHRIKRLVPCRC